MILKDLIYLCMDALGFLEIKSNYVKVVSLKRLILDAQSQEQAKLNQEIKKIYNINFPCSLMYVDPKKMDVYMSTLSNDKERGNLKNAGEDNILIIPRQSTNENTIRAYINQRLRGYNEDNNLEHLVRYKIVNSQIVKIDVAEAIKIIAEKRGYNTNNIFKDPRNKNYTIYRYANLSKRSGVFAYAFNNDETIIYVYFTGKRHGWYKYDTKSAPEFVIKARIEKAKKGYGLNRYINKHPKTYFWKGTY